jgi:hypothetical protein
MVHLADFRIARLQAVVKGASAFARRDLRECVGLA